MWETFSSWEKTVEQMIELNPDSVTIYQTEIPYNTSLYHRLVAGDIKSPGLMKELDALPPPHVGGYAELPISWKEKRRRLAFGFARLERAGYTVVSAYSAVKDPQRHQFQYQNYLWRGGDMLGLGVAAFSHFGGVHFQNDIALDSYMAQAGAGQLPIKRAFALAKEDQFVREFVLQLKWGEVSSEAFHNKFGVDITKIFAPQLEHFAAEGFLNVSASTVQLTRAGLLCVDRLLPHFYQPQHQGLRYT